MNDLNKLLREIHDRAESAAIFAKSAAQLDEQPERKAVYVERVMQHLAALVQLNHDLLALEQVALVAKMGVKK